MGKEMCVCIYRGKMGRFGTFVQHPYVFLLLSFWKKKELVFFFLCHARYTLIFSKHRKNIAIHTLEESPRIMITNINV